MDYACILMVYMGWYIHACPKPEAGFTPPYVAVFFVFNCLNSLRQNLVPDWRITNDSFLLWLTMYYYVLFVCCTLVSEDYFYKAVMEVQFMLCIATLGLNT